MFKRILTSAVLILSLVFTGLMYFTPTTSAATKNPDKVCDFVGQYISSSVANRPCVPSPTDKFAPSVAGNDGLLYSMESGCFDQVATGATIPAGTCYILKNTDGTFAYKVVVCEKDFVGVQALTCNTPADYSGKVSITTAPFNGTTQGLLNCPSGTSTVGNTTFKGGAIADGTYAFVIEQCKAVGTCPINTFGTTIQSQEGCKPCPTGTMSPAGTTTQAGCKTPDVTPCTNGGIAPACTTCPADKDGVIMNGAYTCVAKCATGQTRDASNNCITPKVDQCDANTYGNGKPNCTPCPTGTTSPVGSMTADKCTAVTCPNGATPPACTTCPADKDGVIMNGTFTCVAKCATGQTRDASNNCVVPPVVPPTVTPCPINTFGVSTQAGCTPCPANTTSPAGSTMASQCGGLTLCPANTYGISVQNGCVPCSAGFTSPAGSTTYSQCMGTPTPAKKDEGGFNIGGILPIVGIAAACAFFCGGLFGGKETPKPTPSNPSPAPRPSNPAPRQPVNPCDNYIYGDPRCTPKQPTPQRIGCAYNSDNIDPTGECGSVPTPRQPAPRPSNPTPKVPTVPGKPNTPPNQYDNGENFDDEGNLIPSTKSNNVAYNYDDEGNPTAVAGQFADESGNIYNSETGEMVGSSTVAGSYTDEYNSYASSDYGYENNTSSNDAVNDGYNTFETASADYSDGYNPQTYASSDYNYENNTVNDGYNTFETASADYGYDEGY